MKGGTVDEAIVGEDYKTIIENTEEEFNLKFCESELEEVADVDIIN